MKRPCLVITAITAIAAIAVLAAASPAASAYDEVWGARLVCGLLILKVDDASPAAKAGVRHGDVLEGFDDKAVTDFTSVNDFISALKSAARQRDIAASIWQLDRATDARRHVSISLRLPDDAEARLGLAVRPGVFFREVRAGGAAERAGVHPWDCLDAVEGESVGDRLRLDDFDAHVTSLRNHDGNVRVSLMHWKPTDYGAAQPMESPGAREVVLPVAAR
jgi:S1-C subfamily serine protease